MPHIIGRERDLGGFKVRRVLPYLTQKMVGPFVFFDQMGPADMDSAHAMDVRPHPHINLATVTYLFEGVIEHRDSLGSDQLIEPGAINWMTAGRGIVHSERTPEYLRGKNQRLNGIQLWVALPEEDEECDPSFSHHPSHSLPEFLANGVRGKLLLGEGFGVRSPVPVLSDMIYAEMFLEAGDRVSIPAEGRELAVYVAFGSVETKDGLAEEFTMAVADGDLEFSSSKGARVMVLGGKSLGPRFIDWNFVSTSKERIEEVKREWKAGGPRLDSTRFPPIPSDAGEYIPIN